MNHHHRDLRMRTSLDRHIGRSATEPDEIRAMVLKARTTAGVIVFLPEDLDRMPEIARALIEGEHRRICERGR